MPIILGSIIGTVMGLTGAGGALVSIPIFTLILKMSFKEATVYSLLAVIIASLSNLIFQKKFVNYKISLLLIALSTLGSYLTNPYKKIFPEFYMAILLGIVALYSLYNIWMPSKVKPKDSTTTPVLLTIMVGLVLGALTTFTGLGGGVLMFPILMTFYGFDQKSAVATSLLTVALSSLSSLIIQINSGFDFKFNTDTNFIILGIILSAFIVKLATKKLSTQVMDNVRKVVFTLVVLLLGVSRL